MKELVKKWLIGSACLVLLGCVVFGGAMTMLKWDFSQLSTGKFEDNSHEISEHYQSICILTDTADIEFVPSDTENTTVHCYEEKQEQHCVSVKEDTLFIEALDTRKWYDYIGIFVEAPKITVTLPAGAYKSLTVQENTGDIAVPQELSFDNMDISTNTGDVKNAACVQENVRISTDTGNIEIERISAGMLDLTVSTGKIVAKEVACTGDVKFRVSTGKAYFTDVTCKNMTSIGDTGDISMINVLAEGTLSLERSTGDVSFEHSDAAEIFIETSTGDIRGSLRSEKMFFAQTDTGRVNVPRTVSGGKCEIITDTGDITITVD